MRSRDGAGRTALVTGASAGIGEAIAEVFAAHGFDLVLTARRIDRLQDLADRLVKLHGVGTRVLPADLADARAPAALVSQLDMEGVSIDALVNNAALDPKFDRANAGKHTGSFEDYPLEVWQQSLNVNLTGAFLCTQAAAPFLLSSRRGSVVNIASIYGLVGPDQRLYAQNDGQRRYKPIAYSVTKSALLGFTRYLATYWAGTGLRVNTLTLGGVETDHDYEFVRRYSERTPMGRMARPDEYGAALLFLLSEASSYMTGANLVVDGGWTAW